MKGIKKMRQFTMSQKLYMGVKRIIDILFIGDGINSVILVVF